MSTIGVARRFAWIVIAAALAACGIGCTLLACYGVLSANPKAGIFIVLAWPAYVFAKWTREVWRTGRSPNR